MCCQRPIYNYHAKILSKARKVIAGTGLGDEGLTEYEQPLEELTERYEESERRTVETLSDKKVQSQEDKKKAIDIQQKEMYGKTRKRKDLEGDDDSSKERKSRRKSFDMITFFPGKLISCNYCKLLHNSSSSFWLTYYQQSKCCVCLYNVDPVVEKTDSLSFHLYFLDPFGIFSFLVTV